MRTVYIPIFLFYFGSILGGLEEKVLIYDDPDFGPVERMYLLYKPSNYEQSDNFPLVLDFHGFTMTADEERKYSQWDVLAEEEKFIAVFPEGVPDSPSELRKLKNFLGKKYVLTWKVFQVLEYK